ncbi:MAG: hypothetical protein JWO46_902 [Nocardioidaceae bacterium]|nr:hypothetical protein [Nocardioidaceae bacterium]
MRRGLVALSTVLLLGGLAGCGSSTSSGDGPVVSGVSTSDDHGYNGAFLPSPYQVGDATLTDDTGKPFSLTKDTAGRLNLVFFGYTKCPDVCQIVMGTIASAYARLDDAQKKQVQVLFVTTDPGRDTEQVLRDYLARLDPTFMGIRGSIDQIDAAGKPLHVFVKKGTPLPDGGYEVSHTTSVYAVAGNGQVPVVWNATTSPSEMSADIVKLLDSGKAEASS